MNNSKWSLSTSWVQNSQGSVITQNVKDSGNKYTQREWDRAVGWGNVPAEYSYNITVNNDEWV